MELNSSQLMAVKHFKGPCLVLAGPGSGKTTIIINRIKYLIESCNVSAHNILVITFTKAAAEEMKERFKKINPEDYKVSFGTFHSLFFRIIRPVYNYSIDNIIKDEEKINVLKKIVEKEEINFDDESEFFSDLMNDISNVKNELLMPEEINPVSLRSETFCNVYYEYEKYKESVNKIDFDDMLVKCYELLKNDIDIRNQWQHRYKFILIDEFQDINKAQHECILLLKGEESNVFAVGDDDQSIYGFRGARPEFLLDFGKNFPNAEIISTDVNYRSTNEIIKLSNRVIAQNANRYEKNIGGTGISGKKPILIRPESISDEAEVIARKIKELIKTVKQEEIAVIYRTNTQARAFIDSFMDYNISYQIKDSAPSIYSHWIAKDIKAYLLLALDRSDNNSFERIANKPSRYISKRLMQMARETCGNEDSFIKFLYSSPHLKSYQLTKLEELIYQLGEIVKKEPSEAIRYIRRVVDYNRYIEEYAEYRNIKAASFFEVLNELEEAAKSFKSNEEFIEHMNEVVEESKNNIKNKNETKPYGVMLTTMHGAKGLEFDTVFIAGAVDGVIPHERSTTPEQIEEERRLFYVGITRAKRLLYISITKTRYNDDVKPTRFLHKFIKNKENENEKVKAWKEKTYR